MGATLKLVKTPFARIVETSSASPDFHARHHPYCELLSSMHSWGLYNGRYGMSDKVLLNDLADALLASEIARQQRLKEKLAEDPQAVAWAEDPHVFQNYKQLQFFDTLALYFNCTSEGARTPTVLLHVPMSATEDTEVTITPIAPGMYAFDPFPFDHDDIAVSFNGRYLAPQPAGDSVREALAAVPRSTQTVRLVAAET